MVSTVSSLVRLGRVPTHKVWNVPQGGINEFITLFDTTRRSRADAPLARFSLMVLTDGRATFGDVKSIHPALIVSNAGPAAN